MTNRTSGLLRITQPLTSLLNTTGVYEGSPSYMDCHPAPNFRDKIWHNGDMVPYGTRHEIS